MLSLIIEKTIERVERIKNMIPIKKEKYFKINPPVFIAEVKRKSPSVGNIVSNFDLIEKVGKYIEGGANMISVVTEPFFFNGNIKDIELIKNNFNIPVLRKDFIISEKQIIESLNAGADGILLIVRILDDNNLVKFIEMSKNFGLFYIVECHNEKEVMRALKSNAEVIGINSRNLDTLDVDVTLFERLRPFIPNDVIKIAESGINNKETIKKIKSLGYDGFLVGTKLMRDRNPGSTLKEWISLWKD